MHILILSSHLINLPSGLPLCRGQCEDQRRRPVCLWGAGGEDPADSRPVGEREPGPEDPAGQPAGGWRQSLRRLLLHTLNLPEEPMVHRKLIEMTQRTRIKWRRDGDGEGGRGVLMFARTFAVCTLPFFSTITCLQRKTLTIALCVGRYTVLIQPHCACGCVSFNNVASLNPSWRPRWSVVHQVNSIVPLTLITFEVAVMASHSPTPNDFVPINTQVRPANVHHTEKTSSPLKPLAAAENSD